MSLKRLTKRQREIFNVFVQLNNEKQYPSLALIGKNLRDKIGREAIFYHFQLLIHKGYITKIDDEYHPTSAGVKQYILDTNKPERIKNSWKK